MTKKAQTIAAKTDTRSRAGARSIGDRAEAAARDYLTRGGFFIEGQNVRFGSLEIDIVARRAELLVACEVRHRRATGTRGPLASITHAKRVAMVRAARQLYLARIKSDPTIERFRIDVAVVEFTPEGPTVEYFPGAVTADAV